MIHPRYYSYEYYEDNSNTTSICSMDSSFIDNGGFIPQIQRFKNLVSLKFNNTELNHLDELISLPLTLLDISNNQISSLSPLIYLTTLKFLNASTNPILLIPPLPELKSLCLNNCPLKDNKQTIRSLYKMTTLTCLELPRSTHTKLIDPKQALQRIRFQRRKGKLFKTQKEYYERINNTPTPLIFDSDIYIRTLILFLPLLIVFNKERIDKNVRRLIAQSVNDEVSIPLQHTSIINYIQHIQLGKIQRNYNSFITTLYRFNETPFKQLIPEIEVPRQIEYNKCIPGKLLVSCLNGKIYLYDFQSNISTQIDSPFNSSPYGICWCSEKSKANNCIIGSDTGKLCYYDFSKRKQPLLTIDNLERITSVHLNCNCSKFITSGFETNINLFDFETFKLERVYGSLHNENVNVAKFSNTNPFLFTTCSFDSCAAIWDLRTDCSIPVIKYIGETLLVTTIFSENDLNILIAGCDNYVESIDLRIQKGIKMQLERRWDNNSFCRGYYCNGGESVVISNSHEQTLHITRTYDGKRIIDCHCDNINHQLNFDGIITVRCDPFNDFDFSLVMNNDSLTQLGLFHCQLI
ncbi:hypothetical protein EDI_130780 [Entamoeba dispar SAW760]|uniref:Uncharacterized protein n=1 Tax=Entamoeba dispar (strain ATCC PRA-260 / SAW760) TaxID=370354 RepID=B0E9J4_ENTDS|nr:uncharacterized protein EDI_130780 [Entamoeba dispar SAW760]EDR28801.1 hypothetical protein EDI_130780 [Entamoeba dispar SAW760]|eukprot:EDR28801.1 hypothetical protein EDI_130780 [Entamoeba dispar SAW760]